MNEKEVISKSNKPQTIKTLTRDLKNIGIKEGMVLLVHSSMSSIRWVSGGAVAVILALEKALGESGTLVMPAFSGDLSDPYKWENPPVPENWCDTIIETMPAFDLDLTPTRGVGTIPEVFRKQRGVQRSNHPQVSFTARGKYAEYITGDHSLEHAFGEKSPLAKIYELGGYVILIGVGYYNCTSLHLAEYRADYPSKEEEVSGAPLIVKGKRKWVNLKDVKPVTDDFEKLGSGFMKNKEDDIRNGYIGQAKSQLFCQKDLVDFAVDWMEKNRK
ncbi:MAG: AAC(3) family N-acetyltransferase [Actinomycetota bacterium]